MFRISFSLCWVSLLVIQFLCHSHIYNHPEWVNVSMRACVLSAVKKYNLYSFILTLSFWFLFFSTLTFSIRTWYPFSVVIIINLDLMLIPIYYTLNIALEWNFTCSLLSSGLSITLLWSHLLDSRDWARITNILWLIKLNWGFRINPNYYLYLISAITSTYLHKI